MALGFLILDKEEFEGLCVALNSIPNMPFDVRFYILNVFNSWIISRPLVNANA
jgi:hypothetical protein